jgi:hypothetical protein
MIQLRLAEILLPLVAARAWSPWNPAPRNTAEDSTLQRRVRAARPGGDWYLARAERPWFDDVQ